MALLTGLSAPAASASTPILVGSGGDANQLSKLVGTQLAEHSYGRLSGSVPQGTMLNMAPGTSWGSVASAQPGSSVYGDITRWADTIKHRGGRTLLAFSHEPEADGSRNRGTSGEFISAFRRVHSIFQARGASNVEFVWQMTAYSFRVSSGDRRYAPKWYPGDAYVDDVGVDAYNWYGCGPGSGRWTELRDIIAAPINFTRSHGKQLVLPEFASQSDYRRAQWIRNAHQFFVANRDVIRAVFWFQRIEPRHTECRWPLSSSADVGAYREMVRDTAYFHTSL